MKRIFFIGVFLFLNSFSVLNGQSDFNITLLDHRNDFSELKYADVWGYLHPDGTEYAAIGTRRGVAIYQIDSDGKLKLIQHLQGDPSLWRDMKTYGDYLYAIDDSGDDGLMIINMKQAPRAITWSFWRPEITIGNEKKFLEDCHNLWIDEKGFLYLAGCNLNKGGVLIADLSSNPGQPTFVGATDALYSHDCFASNDRLWSANVSDGSFTVFDVSDKTNPVLLAKQKTGSKFTHNLWPSDDNRYLFTTDEVANAAVEVYDVQDLNNITRLDEYRPAATLGAGVIPHNVHYYRGWLVVSHYTDGVKIIDAHRPDNLVEVGSYDTWPGANGGYHGCWGAFPFLPSGLLLTSNIEDGLRVLRPDYKRACYLEGEVTDAVTGKELNNVTIKILSDQPNIASSNLNGLYKTGQFPDGIFEVEFIKEGYQRKKATAKLTNGEVTVLDVQLFPLKAYAIQGQVIDAESNQVVSQASIIVRNDLSSYETQTDEQGQFTLQNVYAENYEVFVVAWGYQYLEIEGLAVNNAGPYEFKMQRGYQDDFLYDLGWTTENDESVTAGLWQRGDPRGTIDNGTAANPYDDLPDDFGVACYVTGNRGGNSTRDDVDNGTVRLISPPMNLSFYQDPVLTYHLWYYNGLREGDDTLKVFLSNGTEKVLVEQLTDAVSGWREESQIRALDFLSLSDTMYLIVEASDLPGSDHIVEGGIDGFMTFEGAASPTHGPIRSAEVNWKVFPNPSYGPITLSYELVQDITSMEVQVCNSLGQILYRKNLPPTLSGQINIPPVTTPGLYLIRLRIDGRFTEPKKVIWNP